MVRHPEVAAPGPMMPVSLPSSPDVPDDKERRALQLLIVDDDVSQRRLIAIAAKQAGHAVIVAQSCAEALARLGNGRFDCVTLDLMLGDGDGIQVLQAIAVFRNPSISRPCAFASRTSAKPRWACRSSIHGAASLLTAWRRDTGLEGCGSSRGLTTGSAWARIWSAVLASRRCAEIAGQRRD